MSTNTYISENMSWNWHVETWKEASVTVKKTPKRPNSVNMSNETNIYQKGPSWVEGDLQTRLTCYLSREKRPTYMKNRPTKWKETYQKWKETLKRDLLAISHNVKIDLHTWKETYKIERRPSKEALVNEKRPSKKIYTIENRHSNEAYGVATTSRLSLTSQVTFAKEPYKRGYILQKRRIILRSLLLVATP